MCRAALAGTGSAFLALFVGAASVDAATQEYPWYLLALWIGAGVSGALFFITGISCLFTHGLIRAKAIRIRNDWRCTYWTREQQLEVIVWFEDRLRSAQYRVECTAKVGDESIRLNDVVELGGTYMGRRSLISAHSGPIMAEFRKDDVALDAPERAIIRVSIQPRDPWGLAKKEDKSIAIQIVNHGPDEFAQRT